jgi:hypothetical protein
LQTELSDTEKGNVCHYTWNIDLKKRLYCIGQSSFNLSKILAS